MVIFELHMDVCLLALHTNRQIDTTKLKLNDKLFPGKMLISPSEKLDCKRFQISHVTVPKALTTISMS